jgi:hypothetical protein
VGLVSEHTFEILFLEPGVEAYAFTFGQYGGGSSPSKRLEGRSCEVLSSSWFLVWRSWSAV